MNLLLFLGAGFSVEAGYPTQKQFLEKVLQLRRSGIIKEYHIDSVSLAYYLSMYHEGKSEVTMEEAFSMLEYEYLMKNPDMKFAYIKYDDRGNKFIRSSNGLSISFAYNVFIDVLNFVYGYRLDEGFKSEDLYIEFFNKLFTEYDINIVTTNYDYICDMSFIKMGYKIVGGIPFYSAFINEENNKKINIYKLHGSAGDLDSQFNIRTIVPPTWNKSFKKEESFLINCWNESEDIIRDSDIILFLGYSLPQMDNNIRFLLKAGLQSHFGEKKKKYIFVVKPNWTINDIQNYDFIKKSESVYQLFPIELDFRAFAKSDFINSIKQTISGIQ